MSMNTTSAGPGRIVVGVDGSVSGNEALRWAARLAPTLGATIQVVTAWEYPLVYPLPDGAVSLPAPDWKEWEQMSRDSVEQSVREVFGDAPPAGLVTTVENGHPARVLLDAAKGATMLIVGSRGLGGFAGLLLGSVGRYVAEHATCPVLVVHESLGENE